MEDTGGTEKKIRHFIYSFFKKLFYIISLYVYTGIGQSQLSEFCASVEIPSLSSTSYLNNLSTVSDAVNDALIEELKKAGEEERRIAIESENVDEHCYCGWTMVQKKL